jgi:ABC-type Zn uptake system ZnuABC Zn-binding protein ZnuA
LKNWKLCADFPRSESRKCSGSLASSRAVKPLVNVRLIIDNGASYVHFYSYTVEEIEYLRNEVVILKNGLKEEREYRATLEKEQQEREIQIQQYEG